LYFKEELKQYQTYINSVLDKYIDCNELLPEKNLNAAMKYSLMAGGKRIRPILMLATYKLFKNDFKICEPYFVGMEMVHNFSLIHDDLPAIDNDDFRHGKPTNHKKFGENIAIMAGDGLLNYAYIVMTNDLVNNVMPSKVKAINEFSNEVQHMIIGEVVDIESEGKDITLELLEYMHKNKTGALIKESVRIGAILAEASDEDLEILTKYAQNLGLAFQIKDDILSEIGDEKIMGKPAHNDVKEHKSTFVTKYGLEKSESILNEVIDQSINIIEKRFKSKAQFLVKLAEYVRDRDK
jgi:geranylgeranyl diphosphate synthase type II